MTDETGLELIDSDAVAELALETLEEWLPGYSHLFDEDGDGTQFWICQTADGDFHIYPADKSGDGKRFQIEVVVRQVDT